MPWPQMRDIVRSWVETICIWFLLNLLIPMRHFWLGQSILFALKSLILKASSAIHQSQRKPRTRCSVLFGVGHPIRSHLPVSSVTKQLQIAYIECSHNLIWIIDQVMQMKAAKMGSEQTSLSRWRLGAEEVPRGRDSNWAKMETEFTWYIHYMVFLYNIVCHCKPQVRFSSSTSILIISQRSMMSWYQPCLRFPLRWNRSPTLWFYLDNLLLVSPTV